MLQGEKLGSLTGVIRPLAPSDLLNSASPPLCLQPLSVFPYTGQGCVGPCIYEHSLQSPNGGVNYKWWHLQEGQPPYPGRHFKACLPAPSLSRGLPGPSLVFSDTCPHSLQDLQSSVHVSALAFPSQQGPLLKETLSETQWCPGCRFSPEGAEPILQNANLWFHLPKSPSPKVKTVPYISLTTNYSQ